jgi:hypothetical protein
MRQGSATSVMPLSAPWATLSAQVVVCTDRAPIGEDGTSTWQSAPFTSGLSLR